MDKLEAVARAIDPYNLNWDNGLKGLRKNAMLQKAQAAIAAADEWDRNDEAIDTTV